MPHPIGRYTGIPRIVVSLAIVVTTTLLIIGAVPSRALIAADVNRVDTGVRILLIGLDGADWQIADPLIEAGRLPNLARLRRAGAWTSLRSAVPMLSPLLWTSIATGRPPTEHGIIDFLVNDPASGRPVPITSEFRRTKALWNIYSDAGLTSGFIGWWATWPAESIKGHIVSDRFAYSLFEYSPRPGDAGGLIRPASYLEVAESLRVDASDITLADLRRFATFSSADLSASRARWREDPSKAYADPLGHLVRILASTRTYHAIALDLLKRGDADLLSVYYQGIDEVSHRYAQFIPPKLDWVDAGRFEKFRDVVVNFYEYQDELIGELLAAAGSDSTVIIVSDHGFLNGTDRPDYPPDIETKAGGWHRPYGVLVMHGPGIRPRKIPPAGLHDIAPTLLYLSGLPVPADMSGLPLMTAIDPGFEQRFRLSTIETYEGKGRKPPSDGTSAPASDAVDEEYLARLRSLGYIGSEDTASPTPATTLNNLYNMAILQLNDGALEDAEISARSILADDPEHAGTRALLSEILQAQGRLEEAFDEARIALNVSQDPDEAVVGRFAQIARRLDRIEEAKAFFLRYTQLRPRRAEPWLGLGLAQYLEGDHKAAENSLWKALDIDPRSRGAVAGLHNVYQRGGQSPSTVERLERAVALNPDSAPHHTLLGLIYTKEQKMSLAEKELRKALDLEPDNDLALSGLGDILQATGRSEEARQLLEGAVARDSERAEVRLPLGRLYAKNGRIGEATREMAEAVRIEPGSAHAHAQLGMMLAMQGLSSRSIPELERALELDPGLYELRLHLAIMYHELKRLEECEAILLSALEQRDEDPEPYRLLVSLYRETGRPEEADRMLSRLRQVEKAR